MSAAKPSGRAGFVDAMVSAVVQADDLELAGDAVAAGEDLARGGEQLRARFLERVALAQARESGPRTLTDADIDHERPIPSKIGRYPILRRIGAGGMGVVYAAYDEVLDRRLAIKVLHEHVWDTDGRRRERLIREAQAMARVTHPNIITVHDVGTIDEQLFVAMEFVSGPTLKQWLGEQPRAWREVVAVFIQIAEGLAALHDAGLVHRDVTPANVIIGSDGRVRVLDLGLVGAKQDDVTQTDPIALDSSSSLNRIAGQLTRSGERLGTPAYMSREQFLGLEPTPASDIFAFSVVLYEALFSAHPFMAASIQELQVNVVCNKLTLPPNSSTVPSWLVALVIRGLAPDPKDRPPSMHVFAAALGRAPSRTRRRALASFGVAVFAGIAGVLLARTPASLGVPSCDGAELAIAEVWNDARAHELHAAMLATDQPYAAALADRITAGLDDYAAEWATAHHRVCAQHARGDHSATLLDARMGCLYRRRQALAETVTLLTEVDAELVQHAGQMVAKLPRLEACDDLASLASHASPLRSSVGGAIEALEFELVRAEALANAGRLADAIVLARDVAREAEVLDHSPTLVMALLTEARAAMVLRPELSPTIAMLERALALAIVEELDLLAAEAMIRLVYLRALARGSEVALAELPIADAMLVRSGRDPELRALLENNAGAVYLAAGDRSRARAAFERALAIKARLFGEDHLELALGLANLAISTSDEQARRALHRRMIAIYERSLGPEHPRTLDARFLAAVQIADPHDAGAALSEVCPRLLAIDPHLAGECELEQGRLAFARGMIESGHRALESAREQLGASDDRRVLLDAYLALGTESTEHAVEPLREQIAAFDARGGHDWWMVLAQAERRLLLAWLLADGDGAIELLERAIVDLERTADQASTSEHDRVLALARSTLARSLAARGEHDRADALASDARRFFQRWSAAYAVRLHELDQLDALSSRTANGAVP